MRFLELHLDRYGCFTDRRLTFRPDAPLTVVYGPNEAGKSTALAAIADVLYGIEMRSPFDFLHRYADMRIGATILAEDGRQLAFRRRKGSQNTLLGVDETPITDDALLPFLGGVDRALFLDAFGLDRDRLRAGARQVIGGGGRVGESLLAAAPGLSSLIALRSRLAGDADQLFPTGRKVSSRPFWQACERHAEARRRVRQESLRTETVRAARLVREDAAEEVRALKDEQRRVRSDLANLRRLLNALPRLRRIDDLEVERAGLGELPQVGDDFAGRCRASLERHRELSLELQRLEADRVRTASGLEAIAIDDGLLAETDAVDRLVDQRGAIVKAADDLPKREGELAVLGDQLDEVARRLGLADRETLAARRPADAAVARARSLIDRRRRLADRRRDRAAQLAKLAGDLEDLSRRRQALGHVADPAPLRRRLEGFAGLAQRIEARDELRRARAERERELGERLHRLVVAVASTDDLACLPVPDLASIEQAIARSDGLSKRRDELMSERQRLESRRERIEHQVSEIADAGEVPTAEAVTEARAARDAHWLRLRRRLVGGASGGDAAADVAAYESAVARADELADRRQAEAERVAAFNKLQGDRSEVAGELAQTGRSLVELDAQCHAWEKAWVELWAPARLAPRNPREMRGWLEARAEILRLRGEFDEVGVRLGELEKKAAEEMGGLGALVEGLGGAATGDAPALMKSASVAIAEMEQRFHDARLIARQKEDLERARSDLESTLAEVDRANEAWAAEWREASKAVGIRPDALDEEAEAALAAWQEVPALEASFRDLGHRVERMRKDATDFAADARSLCAAVAPDLIEVPPVSAIASLRTRLIAARNAATQREGLVSALAALDERLTEAREQVRLNAQELAGLCAEVEAGDAEALSRLVQRIEKSSALSLELAKERTALAETSEGASEAELRAGLAGGNPGELTARLQELRDEEERLAERLGEAISAEARAAAEEERIASHAGAAAAAQDEQNALAEIAGIIETWSALTAAERLLSAAIEIYRGRHQNPLLEQASAAFAIATAGAFSGIALDYDEADVPRIAAARPDGTRLAVDALSEGTADQLFLSLRVAMIEDHARRARPLPFIADDLFVTFDDARTEAGLRLLADLGRTTQTIVFTHHRHVVEAARRALDREPQVLDLG